MIRVVLQKAFEKTAESARGSSTVVSAGLENLIAKASAEQFRSLDSVSIPTIKSVNSASRSMLGPTATLPQLPFYTHCSVGTNVRAPGVLPSTFNITDSAAIAAASQKLSLQSKGKPLSVSVVQPEQRSSLLSSAAMPTVQHQLVAGSQSAAFGLINSQLRKAADSSLAAVLVAPPGSSTAAAVKSAPAGMPPRVAYSLSSARVSLPPVSSASISFSSANSPSVTFSSSVPSFSSVSKPVVARLMAQQRLPGVLALSGMVMCLMHVYFCFYASAQRNVVGVQGSVCSSLNIVNTITCRVFDTFTKRKSTMHYETETKITIWGQKVKVAVE